MPLVLCESEGPHRAGGKRAALAMAMVRVPALLGPMVVGIVSKPGGEVLASGPRESVEEEGATLAPPVFSRTTPKILRYSRVHRGESDSATLVWIRRDLWASKEFGIEDCFPVGANDRWSDTLILLIHSSGEERETFSQVAKKMAFRGRGNRGFRPRLSYGDWSSWGSWNQCQFPTPQNLFHHPPPPPPPYGFYPQPPPNNFHPRPHQQQNPRDFRSDLRPRGQNSRSSRGKIHFAQKVRIIKALFGSKSSRGD